MLLQALPSGSKVAVVTMVGSLCPVTLGHVQCYVEARKLLLDQEPSVQRPPKLAAYSECLGFVYLNSDRHVKGKIEAKGQKSLDIYERAELIDLATREMAWLRYDEGDHRSDSTQSDDLKKRFPNLRFQQFRMNGADDVKKYRKWVQAKANYRMIIMGRPGSTDAVRKGMASADVAPEHCILGPELPDISSSQAREASAAGDQAGLLQMLHPTVASWLLRRDGHPALADAIAAASAQAPAADAGAGQAPSAPDVPFVAIRSVQRSDDICSTMLRAVPDPRRVDEVWLPSQKCVRNGDVVELLSGDDDFARVRAVDDRTEGYIQSTYLRSASALSQQVVRRDDDAGSTLLRGKPDARRVEEVWLASGKAVRDGDVVDLLSGSCAGGMFSIVRTADDGTEGYLLSRYLQDA